MTDPAWHIAMPVGGAVHPIRGTGLEVIDPGV